MKAIVTGGTGFVGRRLVEDLVRSGHDVTVLARDPDRAAARLPAKCRVVRWDAREDVEPQVLRGADAVVHLAGEGVLDARWTERRKAQILESRTRSAASLVRAIETVKKPDRPRVFVSASAIGWYGNRGDERLDEKSAPGAGFLADVCRAWEEAIAPAGALGVRTVSVRIGIVLGRGGGALEAMLLPFRLGLGGRLGSGRQWMSWIHLDDLVALIRLAIEDDRVCGPLNGVAPRPARNAAFTATLARVLGRPALFPVPAAALQVLLGEMGSVLLDSQRVRPRAAQQLGFSFRFPTLRKALADLSADPSREIVAEQWVAQPPERVFPFFSDPANLEKITPPFLHFRVLGATTEKAADGTLIDYALSLHGLPMRWRSRIEEWVPNRRFVDVQLRGPYRLWHHTHEFEPVDGGTLIRDRVRYELPLGVLGDLAAGWLVRRDLDSIFDFRRRKIEEVFR